MSDWQPIETAPKDGNEILVFYQTRKKVVIAYWEPQSYNKKPRPYWAAIGSHWIESDRKYPPTHWMPLPAPPED